MEHADKAAESVTTEASANVIKAHLIFFDIAFPCRKYCKGDLYGHPYILLFIEQCVKRF